MKTKRLGLALLVVGAVLATAGVITSVVYLFQPWRTCPYDDTPSACAMLPSDAAVLMLAVFATIVGVFLAAGGAVASSRRRDFS